MEKLVKPNPKKEKRKTTTTTTTESFAKPPLSKFPPQDCTTQALPNHKQREKKLLFSTSYERSNSANTRIAHEKTKRGSIEEEENVPTKIQKILDTRPTHSLTHSLTHSQRSTQFNNNNFNSTGYERSILIFAEYKRENR